MRDALASNTIVVRKRFGSEQLDVREFVRPDTWMSANLAEQIWQRSHGLQDYITRCWRYVVSDIKMPPGQPATLDWHSMSAYHESHSGRVLLFYETNDFWNYPSETIRDKYGDCDDKAILLVSLLRRRVGASQVFATVGTLGNIGHMWVTLYDHGQAKVLETTMQIGIQLEQLPYSAYFRFNDQQVRLVKPYTAMPEMHQPLREGVGIKWQAH